MTFKFDSAITQLRMADYVTDTLTIADLQAVNVTYLYAHGFARWNHDLILMPPACLKMLDTGSMLESIMGDRACVGTDYIDLDTRGGVTAYGFRHPELAPE